MKVAIVHYWFVTRRGGEKVVESILKIFPDADIYTLFFDEATYGDHLKKNKVYTSKLNQSSFLRKHYQKIFPLYPYGIRSLKLQDDYDLIISSESGPAKGIDIPNGAPHLCYIHSPMRYCWGGTQDYLNSLPKILRPFVNYLFSRLRKWDETTINNATHYIANSKNVASRVEKFYNKKASVIHPPIALELFDHKVKRNKNSECYLSFGAITPYKRIDLLVDVFNKNGKDLVIIGNGSERQKLEKRAKSNIKFLGSLEWNEIEEVLKNTKALLFPGEEDFGMIPLEVMAYGIPVLAYGKGGALETVVENKNTISESSGLFFSEQTEASLNSCIQDFEKKAHLFDEKWIINHARKYGEDVFLTNFKDAINEIIGGKKPSS